MRTLSGILLILHFSIFSQSSAAQGLKKTPISTSGCSLYSYCEMKFDTSKSPDSSQVYAGECEKEEITYGTICVKLVNPPETLQMAEDLLIAYLDFLKGSFKINRYTGYSKGLRLNRDENTRGILDYWEDAENQKWKVKAWTDGKYIGVMYAYSLKEIPEPKVNAFLDGFRLPQHH